MDRPHITPSAATHLTFALRTLLVVLCLAVGLFVAGCQKSDTEPNTAATTSSDGAGALAAQPDVEAGDADVINSEDFESGSLDSLELQPGEADDVSGPDDESHDSEEPPSANS